jgi:hypothetical protein
MAFASTVTDQTVVGNIRMVYGTFTNGETDSGGDITPGLDNVRGFSCVPTGQVGATMPKYSFASGVITLVTDNGVDGNWIAWGN